LNRFVLITGAIAILAAATSAGFAQRAPPGPVAKAKPLPAPPSPVTHPAVAAIPTLVAPARNAIGLPAPSPAANGIGAAHGPGHGGPNIDAAKPSSVSIGGIRSDASHAQVVPLKANGTLNGSRMGHSATGAAMLGGGATHAPSAVIDPNASTRR
jgi:hypothetical protein